MPYSNTVTGFTKLFSTIVHSTVWREDMHVKVVWVTMLALADRNGEVQASLPGLADAARVSLRQCTDALKKLMAPDKYSRTKEHQGRRVEVIDGGWKLLNYLKYREMRSQDERRLQTREAVQRHRAKAKKAEALTVSQGKPRKAQAEAEAEAEAENGSAVVIFDPSKRSIYVREVWLEWCRGIGKDPELCSSPAEFAMACGWFDQGINLAVVFQAMSETLQRGKKPGSLTYLDGPVQDEAQRVRRAMSL